MSIVIKKRAVISQDEMNSMKLLIDTCNSYDGTNSTVDMDDSFKEADDENTFLLYEGCRLVSFTTLFIPGMKEAEVSAFTLPEFRNRGFFRMLLHEAGEEMIRRGISDFLFVCHSESFIGKIVLEYIDAKYEFSEYSMKMVQGRKIRKKTDSLLEIRKAAPEDRNDLLDLALISFCDDRKEAEIYVKSVFASENRIQHVGVLDNRVVGMISVYRETGKSYIHGLCILPEYRHRGFGRELLAFKVNESLKLHPENEIELEVQTDNRSALSLYEDSGFSVQARYDYYRKPVRELI